MANVAFTPKDCHTFINELTKELTGQYPTIQAIDTSTFVALGRTLMERYRVESIFESISEMLGRTIISVRGYSPDFDMVEADNEEYANLQRKISYFCTEAEASQDFNTDLTPNQLDDGNSVDMYKIKKVYPLQTNFGGAQTYQFHYTVWRYQLRGAFANEAGMAEFLAGQITEINNNLAQWRESRNRGLVLNFIAATLDAGRPESKVNLTTAFNTAKGTTYTSQELRTTHLPEFSLWFAAYLKTLSSRLERRTELYHITPAKNDDHGNPLHLLRHTPRADQRLMLYSPLFNQIGVEARALIFNQQFLDFPQFREVIWWQNANDPSHIKVTPRIYDVTTGDSKEGAQVDVPYLVGVMFDRPAMVMVYKLDETVATPVNAAGSYYNIFHHWLFRPQCDQTENAVVFYMADTDLYTGASLCLDECAQAEPVTADPGTPAPDTRSTTKTGSK